VQGLCKVARSSWSRLVERVPHPPPASEASCCRGHEGRSPGNLQNARAGIPEAMGINGPEYREEFLVWLKNRIESAGYTPDSAPSYLKDAYVSGDPKALNALVWQEWFDYNNSGWRQKAYENGGFRSRHGERHESPKLKRGYNG